jgi:two-component system phosphate regulon sensor histidine kinase PhoR
MVEELLELSAIESGQQPLSLQKTEIAPLLSEAAERLATQAERSQVSVTLELAPDLGSMRIDAARIERAVLNLLHNAIKFTPPNGSVTLSAQRNDGELIVTVRDSGAGIASSDLPRIFERFYKADQSRAGGGTGLGLALVKHAVEAHGGSVHVESEVGRGSCFTLRIPAES